MRRPERQCDGWLGWLEVLVLAVREDVGTSEVSQGRPPLLPPLTGRPGLLPLDVPGGEDAVAALTVELGRKEDRGGGISPDLTPRLSLHTGGPPAQPRSAGGTEGI